MDRKEILNYPPDKFLIPVYKIYLIKWIVSHINKPYVYTKNRVGLDYFLNMPSNRLD